MHSEKYFTPDFSRLALMLLPTFLRKPLLCAVAQAMTSVFGRMNAETVQWRRLRLEDLKATGQVRVMRHRLNDLLDPIERRVEIADGTAPVQWFAYERGRQGPADCLLKREDMMTSFPQCYRRGEAGGETGFVVRLPAEVYADNEKRSLCRAYVTQHKLAGKTFEIEIL